MDKLSKGELLIKVYNELLERLVRNEIDVKYYKAEDDFVNTADAKRVARNNRDQAKENIRQIKQTLKIIEEMLDKQDTNNEA